MPVPPVSAAPPSPLAALARFHAGAVGSAALRAGTIGVAGVIFAFGMAPDPAWTLRAALLGLVAPGGGGAWDGAQTRLLLGALALGLARIGARRVGAGATGWMASLPVAARTARRAAWAGATLAALPMALVAAEAVALAAALYGVAPTPLAVATLPLLLAAAVAAALPVRPAWAAAAAGRAQVAAAWPTPAGALLGAALL
ncbi:hypothetical protein PYV61_24360, partial [Roseisolibacter sp. H3M3-2]